MKTFSAYHIAIPGPVASRTELARSLGLTKEDLKTWMAKPGFPEPHKGGGWRVEECRKFIRDQR